LDNKRFLWAAGSLAALSLVCIVVLSGVMRTAVLFLYGALAIKLLIAWKRPQ
jgi:hypothetical protein